MVLGLLRVARTTRTRWEPVSLLAGGLLTVVGLLLPVVPAFFAGLLVLIVALLKGIASHGKGVSQSADCWDWHS